jgi:hypothetical protein
MTNYAGWVLIHRLLERWRWDFKIIQTNVLEIVLVIGWTSALLVKTLPSHLLAWFVLPGD